jgi:hypothetical protein
MPVFKTQTYFIMNFFERSITMFSAHLDPVKKDLEAYFSTAVRRSAEKEALTDMLWWWQISWRPPNLTLSTLEDWRD